MKYFALTICLIFWITSSAQAIRIGDGSLRRVDVASETDTLNLQRLTQYEVTVTDTMDLYLVSDQLGEGQRVYVDIVGASDSLPVSLNHPSMQYRGNNINRIEIVKSYVHVRATLLDGVLEWHGFETVANLGTDTLYTYQVDANPLLQTQEFTINTGLDLSDYSVIFPPQAGENQGLIFQQVGNTLPGSFTVRITNPLGTLASTINFVYQLLFE